MSGTKWRHVVEEEGYGCGTSVSISLARMRNPIAELASSLAERWGMVAGVPDGEDSSGRSRIRPMTAEEITNHACETAECLYAEFDRRGWIDEIPAPKARIVKSA